MYLLDNTLKFPKENFNSMVYQPYELKPSFSMKRVKQWHDYWKDLVYIALSGGLDSTVMAYIVCEAYIRYELSGTVYLVFADTGMEYPEIREFVKYYASWLQEKFPMLEIVLEIVRPDKNFKQVCEEEGFPLISKEVAAKIRKLRHGNLSERYRNYLLNGDERGKFGMLPKCHRHLVYEEYDVSERCCIILKEGPLNDFEKRTGRKPFVGITQDESFVRSNKYNHTGCNIYSGNKLKSQPIAFFLRDDVLHYKVSHSIPICSVYGEVKQDPQGNYYTTGENRTGCVPCGFGAHKEKEPNRFQRLSCSDCKSHRAMYNWVMRLKNNGVTYQEALESCNIPVTTWESEGQLNFDDIGGVLYENI